MSKIKNTMITRNENNEEPSEGCNVINRTNVLGHSFPEEKRWGKSKQNESVRINGHGKLTKSISLHTKEAA